MTMPGMVNSVRTHNVSVVATITSPAGVRTQSTKVIPGEQETYSYRSGAQGPSVEEELRQDSQIYVASSKFNSLQDTGHEFYSRDSRFVSTSIKDFRCEYPSAPGWWWQGPIVPLGNDGSAGLVPPVSRMTSSSMKSHGTRAINSTVPTKPDAGIAQFLGELKRDGIPDLVALHLCKDKFGPKVISEEFLNLQFGWAPLVSDIEKLLKSVRSSSQTLKQLRRDSGRQVRRRFSFPAIKSVERTEVVNETAGSQLFAAMPLELLHWNSSRTIAITDVLTERIWFAGAYTYYCDMGDTLMKRFEYYEQAANKLLGSRITPTVLYDLTPWSWLLDWWADLGTVISSASAFQSDGLVIRYGYLMREKIAKRTVGSSFRLDGSNTTIPVTNSYLTVSKERYKSTPYGFGLTNEAFSLRQWAILGALGMTLAPGLAR